MIRIIKIMGICGFVTCLFIMYGTNYGIRGIQLYNRSFRLLDMQFHYNNEIIRQTFEQIGTRGRSAYQRFLILDFIFILCFFITMITFTGIVFASSNIRAIFFAVCGLRALFDIIENILLLIMLGRYPVFGNITGTLCSWFTTLKFIMLYIWYLFILLQAVRYIWLNFHKY